LNGQAIEKARQLGLYVKAAMTTLEELDSAALQNASWKFPSPILAVTQP
jgi:cytochrome b pre-mRNA-processing protein 3